MLGGRAVRAGALHLLISTASVQGLGYLAQLVLARLLKPEAFGQVRIVENYLSFLIVMGSAGMPSLAVKAVAHLVFERDRQRLLGALIVIAISCGALIAAGTVLTGHWFLHGPVFGLLVSLAGIIPLTAVDRTTLNYFQGIMEFKRVSLLSFAASLISILLVLGGTWRFGLNGWAIGKYLGELTFAGVLFRLIWRRINWSGALPSTYPWGRLLYLGLPIAIGIAVRNLLDAADLLTLNYLGRPSPEVGVYALSWLLVVAATLVPGVVTTIMIPRMSAVVDRPAELRATFRRLLWLTTLLAAGMTGILIAGRALVPMVFGVRYQSSTGLLLILAPVVIPRSLETVCGAVLLVCDRTSWTAGANLGLLALAEALYFRLIPTMGAAGAAVGTFILELVAVVLLLGLAQAAQGYNARMTRGFEV